MSGIVGAMHRLSSFLCTVFVFACALSLAPTVSAHEVYVLSHTQIDQAVGTPRFSMLAVVEKNMGEFTLWAFISLFAVFCVFFISILRILERYTDPFLLRLRPYAPFVGRMTIGLSFLAGAYYHAAYGPELPLSSMYGSFENIATEVLVIIGLMTIIGLFTRVAACIGLVIYAIAVWFYGWYMLMYLNYVGELIVLLLLGAHMLSVDRFFYPKKKKKTRAAKKTFIDILAPYSFPLLRVCFGISLIAASVYAKVIHNNLGLDTVIHYHLDTLLGFEPHFLVLGAAIIEIVIGSFILLGIEIRFTALFFEFWLVQSLVFFGEAVWPHIILIGIPIALIMYGYDNNSVEGYFFRDKEYEPVL
jgi:uncharacterized membrane protein YphA (DoxX/SURF4 family)